MDIYSVSLLFCLAYGVGSIFGFGGTILSIILISFFLGAGFFKEVIFINIIVSIIGSVVVYFTDPDSFQRKYLRKLLMYAIPGTIIGSYFLDVIPTVILLKTFAVFLILYALKTLFIKEVSLSNVVRNSILSLSGLLQGSIGTGGPFVVMGSKDLFEDKRHLRVTIQIYFLLLNSIRFIQLQIQGTFEFSSLIQYRPVYILVPITIIFAYQVHLKVSNRIFDTGMAILLLVAGIRFLF